MLFQVSILQELHQQVNMAVTGWSDELCLADLSARDLVLSFRHRTLLLYKLLLLEKRSIFFGGAAGLGQMILTLVSLFPRMIEQGLYYASGDYEDQSTDKNDNIFDDGKDNEKSDSFSDDDRISYRSTRSNGRSFF